MMMQKDNRAYNAGEGMSDSPDSVRRAGGEAGMDPRRVDAKIVIDRKVMDHDQSGYNHANSPTADSYAAMQERKAMGMGTPSDDGLYSK